MSIITSNASCNPLSISVTGKTNGSGTISWSLPTVPASGTINSCKLTGTCTISDSSGKPATVKVNGTSVSSGVAFTINLGTGNTTTSVAVTATGPHKNTKSTITFSNLVYTVDYEMPLVLESISLNNTTITVEKNKTKTITAILNPSECLLSDLQWSSNNNNCKIYPNPTGYDESTDQQNNYGLNCEILGYEVGTSIITVTTSDGTKSASCTVTVVESINNDIEIIWDHGHVLSETGEIVSMVDDGDTYIYTHMIHVDPIINEYKLTITNQKGFYLTAYSYDSNCNYIGRLTQSNNNYFVDDAVNEVINLPDNASYVRFRSSCILDKSHKSLVDSQDKITINVKAKYTVIFKDWDGTVLNTQQVVEGASATAPTNPTRDGYDFTGWDVSFSNITSNLTVTAQYSIKTYTVTFKDHDGTTLKTQTVTHGNAAIAPSDPTRDGYDFTGWDKSFNNITSDLTVTAQYTQIKIEAIELDTNNIVLSTGETATVQAHISPAQSIEKVKWSVNNSNVLLTANNMDNDDDGEEETSSSIILYYQEIFPEANNCTIRMTNNSFKLTSFSSSDASVSLYIDGLNPSYDYYLTFNHTEGVEIEIRTEQGSLYEEGLKKSEDTFKGYELNLNTGYTFKFYHKNGTTSNWEVTNLLVVNQNGTFVTVPIAADDNLVAYITGVSEGESILTCSNQDRTVIATCNITVKPEQPEAGMNNIKLGSDTIKNMYIGDSRIIQMYLNGQPLM